MNSSLIIAMNSMSAYQNKMDIISDNVANIDTVGYKKKNSIFADLLNNTKQQPESFELEGRLSPNGFTQGWGSRVAAMVNDFTQGTLKETQMLTDIAIQGRGLFEIQVDEAGTTAYTRDGSFQISLDAAGQGILATTQGYPVIATLADGSQGRIVIPEGYTMQVQPDGTVLAANELETITLGRINVVDPIRPEAMTQVADNLFAVSDGLNVDDVLQRIIPGENNNLSLKQGYLEQSNVDLTIEMTDLVRAQRAYQLASRALSSSDTMMQISNNLRS